MTGHSPHQLATIGGAVANVAAAGDTAKLARLFTDIAAITTAEDRRLIAQSASGHLKFITAVDPTITDLALATIRAAKDQVKEQTSV